MKGQSASFLGSIPFFGRDTHFAEARFYHDNALFLRFGHSASAVQTVGRGRRGQIALFVWFADNSGLCLVTWVILLLIIGV